MKNKNLTNFISALKSSRYKQTFGRLKCGDSYCAMGVAVCLYLEQNKDRIWQKNACINISDSSDKWTHIFPEMASFLGVSAYVCALVTFWNDTKKKSFAEIATNLESGEYL